MRKLFLHSFIILAWICVAEVPAGPLRRGEPLFPILHPFRNRNSCPDCNQTPNSDSPSPNPVEPVEPEPKPTPQPTPIPIPQPTPSPSVDLTALQTALKAQAQQIADLQSQLTALKSAKMQAILYDQTGKVKSQIAFGFDQPLALRLVPVGQ